MWFLISPASLWTPQRQRTHLLISTSPHPCFCPWQFACSGRWPSVYSQPWGWPWLKSPNQTVQKKSVRIETLGEETTGSPSTYSKILSLPSERSVRLLSEDKLSVSLRAIRKWKVPKLGFWKEFDDGTRGRFQEANSRCQGIQRFK